MSLRKRAATGSKGAVPAAPTTADAAMTARRLHGPAWRWELAHGSGSPRMTSLNRRLFDEQVIAAQRFLTARRRAAKRVDPAAADYPLIAAAEAIQRDAPRLTALKLLVLANEDPAAIAARLDLHEDMITTWERLFFDVRGARTATAWVHNHVILPELKNGDALLAAKYKLAYTAGPVGAAAVLDLDERLPLTAAEHVFQRALKAELMLDALAALSLHAGTAPAVQRQVTQYHLASKKLELEKLKLTERCATARRRHERKLAELALQRERLHARRALLDRSELGVSAAAASNATSVEESPVEESPVEESPVEESPVEESPVEAVFAEAVSADSTATETPAAVTSSPPPSARRSRRRVPVAPHAEVPPSWDAQEPDTSPDLPLHPDKLVAR